MLWGEGIEAEYGWRMQFCKIRSLEQVILSEEALRAIHRDRLLKAYRQRENTRLFPFLRKPKIEQGWNKEIALQELQRRHLADTAKEESTEKE